MFLVDLFNVIINFWIMVSVRILFRSHLDKKFLAFSMNEAYELISEYDSSNIVSVHIYPNYHGNE